MRELSLAMRILAFPLQTWKLINGEATTGALEVVIDVGIGAVPTGHPLLGA
jgi:hypothetical protein